MSNENDRKMMTQEAFQMFLGELQERMAEFEVDAANTAEFMEEALKMAQERLAEKGPDEYFSTPQPDFDDE